MVMPEVQRTPDQATPEAGHAGIVTKLTQLVRITEQVRPEKEIDGARTILQIAQMAHTLVQEITVHLKEQDKRIAELENLATTDALTRVLDRRGFEDSPDPRTVRRPPPRRRRRPDLRRPRSVQTRQRHPRPCRRR